MIKKFFGIILFMLLICPCSFAQTVLVQAMEDFSTENPPETLSVMLVESVYKQDETLLLKGGSIIKGKIVDVKSPKRFKRNAGFTFVPVSYTDKNGQTIDVSKHCTAKYTTLMDKGDLAKKAALGVGNYFVKGLSLGYSAVEGAVKNEKDNRLKSTVNSVYEDSPLSFAEKGKDIVIRKNEHFLLRFKVNGEPEDEPED